MNTRLIEKEFDFCKPATLDEALEILATKENVKILAGGTDLIVKLKTNDKLVMDLMMDIKDIDDLFGVTKTEDGAVRIGGAERISVLEKDETIVKDYPALAKAMHSMASPSVRNMATIGGNFCNASPVADTVGPCMCYGAQVELTSKKGVRTVDATEFFVGPGRTVAEPDEILTAIILPAPKENTGDAFTKISRVRPDIAKISLTCAITRDGDKVDTCRIAMGTVAPTPKYFGEISSALDGKKMTAELIEETAEKLTAAITPRKKSRSSTPEYKKAMTYLMTKENIGAAWKASGGELA